MDSLLPQNGPIVKRVEQSIAQAMLNLFLVLASHKLNEGLRFERGQPLTILCLSSNEVEQAKSVLLVGMQELEDVGHVMHWSKNICNELYKRIPQIEMGCLYAAQEFVREHHLWLRHDQPDGLTIKARVPGCYSDGKGLLEILLVLDVSTARGQCWFEFASEMVPLQHIFDPGALSTEIYCGCVRLPARSHVQSHA